MEIRTLKQRSKQWYQHRNKYVNATEIATITNNDKYRSLNQLIHDKLFGTAFVGNKFTEYGVKTEPIAKLFFEKIKQRIYEPTIFVDDNDTFSASLDGYDSFTNTILEIKCPFIDENNQISSSWNNFLSIREIPLNYYYQMQCQLYCSQAKLVYFLVYLSETNYFIEKVYPNEKIWNEMINKTKIYLDLLNKTKNELLNTTYLKNLAKKNL
ncbi:lambda-exonuclease family protein [Candidatus Phytoplasma pyri]|uniref:lambda-exonuclease family protein n=1 Tax=Candidatus Phytoplasma pyri TaxID=47566 RepID=UPI003983D934